jgi:hypothetical protein
MTSEQWKRSINSLISELECHYEIDEPAKDMSDDDNPDKVEWLPPVQSYSARDHASKEVHRLLTEYKSEQRSQSTSQQRRQNI